MKHTKRGWCCIFRADLETNLSATFTQKTELILYHNQNYKSINISKSKTPSDGAINQITPCCPELHDVQQKIPISSG